MRASHTISCSRAQSVPISANTGPPLSLRTADSACGLKAKTIDADTPCCARAFRRSSWYSLNPSRISRRSRLRRTAVYALLETAYPTYKPGSEEGSRITRQRTNEPSIRRPAAKTRLNAACPRRACRRSFTYRSSLTVSFQRPFARRRESTLRPAFVAIRARNPCVFFRFRTCG